MKKIISIVIPIFNEEDNINELYKQLAQIADAEKKYYFEIIAVEHGSTDNSFERLLSLRRRDKRIKILQLSKNFGYADAGISAGLAFARGNAAVIIMGDLQEPPSLITQFLRKWEEGYEIVYGIVKKRTGASISRRILSILFYKILNKMTDNIFPENVSDFRLLDRKVYEVVNQMPERNRFLRGMIAWSGFNQTGIPYKRNPRFAGQSKAYFLTVFNLAITGIFAFSYMPLKLVTIIGFILTFFSFCILAFHLVLFSIYGRVQPGVTTIVLLITFLFGMLFFILGIIGEYLSRIYEEVKQRPNFIVKNKIGF